MVFQVYELLLFNIPCLKSDGLSVPLQSRVPEAGFGKITFRHGLNIMMTQVSAEDAECAIAAVAYAEGLTLFSFCCGKINAHKAQQKFKQCGQPQAAHRHSSRQS